MNTITLDDDVAACLETRRGDRPLQELANELLRAVLAPEPYKVKPYSLGQIPGLAYNNTSVLIEQIEGPLHR